MYNTTSTLLSGTEDPLIYFSDVDYVNKNVEETHKGYLEHNQFTAAATYLKNQNGITPYNADLFNMFENRIIALQTYLLTKSGCDKTNNINTEPINPIASENWISDL